MKHLYPYLRRFRKESILAPLFKMLEATFDLLVPMVVADIIKVGIAGGDTTYIWTRCGLLVLMALIGLLCSFTAQYFAARAAIGTSTGLRHELMAHIQSLSFSELDTLGADYTHDQRRQSDAEWSEHVPAPVPAFAVHRRRRDDCRLHH